jgi:L-lactate dehydrogenase complex protein LldE
MPGMAAVALFDPCYLQALRPGDAASARRVLEALGDTVTLIDGRCCGQPAFNSGFLNEARAVGRQLLRAARAHAAIVTASGSCTAMVRHCLPALWEPPRSAAAAAIASRFVDFPTYVARHPGFERLGLRLPGVVALHESCHSRRELGASAAVAAVLARIEGLEVREPAFAEECCGFGGTFAVKEPEVSVEMMRAKLEALAATGARVVVSPDYSCLAHLQAGAAGLGIQLEGWTLPELLARALE